MGNRLGYKQIKSFIYNGNLPVSKLLSLGVQYGSSFFNKPGIMDDLLTCSQEWGAIIHLSINSNDFDLQTNFPV